MVYLLYAITILLYLWLFSLAVKRFAYGKAIRRFSLLLFLSALWMTIITLETYFQATSAYNIVLLRILGKLDYSIAASISFFVTAFAIHFPKENKNISFPREVLLFLPVGILAVLSWTGLFYTITDNERYQANLLPYSIYIGVLILYFLIIPYWQFFQNLKNTRGLVHLQTKYIIIGYGISVAALLFMSIANAINESGLSDIADAYIANASAIFVAMSFYTVFRYRLLNIRVAIKRGVLYGVTLVPLLIIYTYIILIAEQTIVYRTGVNQQLSLFLAVLVISLSFLPLYRFVRRIIKPLFYRKEEDPAWLEKQLNEATKGSLTLESLIHRMKFYLGDILKYRDFAIFVFNKAQNAFTVRHGTGESLALGSHLVAHLSRIRKPLVHDEIPFRIEEVSRVDAEELRRIEGEMRQRNIALALPMGREGDLNGIITFREKPKKEAFDREEIEHLEEFQREAGSALDSTILYYEAIERVRRQVRGERG